MIDKLPHWLAEHIGTFTLSIILSFGGSYLGSQRTIDKLEERVASQKEEINEQSDYNRIQDADRMELRREIVGLRESNVRIETKLNILLERR